MHEPEVTDEQLLSARDAASFELFYCRQVDAVLGFFARRTGDPELAADLCAETFAAALSGRLFVGNQGDATLTTIGLRSHKPIGSPLPLPVESGYIVGVSAGERGVWVGVRKTPGVAIRVSPTQRRVVRPVGVRSGR